MAVEPTRAQCVTITRLIDATPERVFAAWTTPEMMRQWNTSSALPNRLVEVDLRVGGRYRVEMLSPRGNHMTVSGEYREIDPPHHLVYTWFWETNPALGTMLITVDFHRRGERTEIVLVHSGLTSDESAAMHRAGWQAALPKLDALCVQG